MITIRTGELFVEKYNEENGTNFTPKEIFCMLAEKVFEGGKHMVNLTNSKFFQYLKDYNKFLKGEKDEPSFELALTSFCDDLENRNCGVETSMNVFGGCAEKGNDGYILPRTEFNYCDNIHFSIDERYCSFIGSFFSIGVNEFLTVINNKEIIWLLYKSFNEYYEFIHNNDSVADKQLPTWNGCYFYAKIRGINEYIYDKKLKKNGSSEKLETINFLEFLDALSRIDSLNIKTLEFESFGQTNTTCGCITINLDNARGWFNIFDKVVETDNEDFDLVKYAKVFNKRDLLRLSMEYGEITADMINPLLNFRRRKSDNEFNEKTGGKFIKTYLEIIMKKEEQELAKSFGAFLTSATKAKSKKAMSFASELENVFKSRKTTDLGESIIALCEKASEPYNEGTVPYEVITYFSLDENKPKLLEFLTLTKFNR